MFYNIYVFKDGHFLIRLTYTFFQLVDIRKIPFSYIINIKLCWHLMNDDTGEVCPVINCNNFDSIRILYINK